MILMAGDFLIGLFIIFLINTNGYPKFSLNAYSDLWALLFTPVLILASYFCEIYNIKSPVIKTLTIRCLVAMAISFCLLIWFSHTAGATFQMIAGIIIFLCFQISWQSLYHKSFQSSFFIKNILVIGTGSAAIQVEKILKTSSGKYSLKGYISTPMDPIDVDKDKILGKIDNIIELSKEHKIHTIVIALTERRGNLAINKLVSCKLIGIRIVDYPNLYETITGKIPVESINPSWLVQSNGFLITPYIKIMKRIFDILLSSLLLLITMPFFPIVVFMVKYQSPGPIFYLQDRVGERNKNFTIYKFRSMGMDAETKLGAAWARENDPRISKYGSFMRKLRIDELPQLINVLKGQMSFIGPRPERPEFVSKISDATPYYMERHAVKPGITGWAQVMYPYGSSLGDSIEKLRYDLYYINNLSLLLEMLIVFETVKVILFRKGSR
ncbi:MAG: TIGR03013 family PEP-CTERM/XrtA system glycosyltransferase [Desulfobacteraceae bacterium]|nr:TIGR03013 family PEP-CTERM/XrtA system glycosyltransferase [Desulfobacteraceae bacterium]